MIRTEREYKAAKARLVESRTRLEQQHASFAAKGYTADQTARGMAPLLTFHQQLEDDIVWYENARSGKLDIPTGFDNVGRLLISLRIASGISQAELAKRLAVSEAMVSRDETNEYHGIAIERAQRIARALGKKLETIVIDDMGLDETRELVSA